MQLNGLACQKCGTQPNNPAVADLTAGADLYMVILSLHIKIICWLLLDLMDSQSRCKQQWMHCYLVRQHGYSRTNNIHNAEFSQDFASPAAFRLIVALVEPHKWHAEEAH